MKAIESVLTKERLEYVRAKRAEAREAALSAVAESVGRDTARALAELYGEFDERIYIFLAGLYDRDMGAFYYSESARDTDIYLPDIESTAQVLKFVKTTGMVNGGCTFIKGIPEFLRDSVTGFAYGLQDPDGYFYHPQWGKDISVSRRGRDLSWSKNILAEAGVSPKYPLPTAKRRDGEAAAPVPEHLQSIGAFKKYLLEMKLSGESYYVGNVIESTLSEITARGEEYGEALLEWLNLGQRADNGLWEKEINYSSVNGLMKLSASYPHLKAQLPHAERSLESAIFAALSDERMKFVCEAYNPWAAIINIFKASGYGSDGELSELGGFLVENAPRLIDKTREKISVFRKNNGSYSYFKRMSSAVSQRAPVAVPRTNEGDVNATTICVGSTVRNMTAALSIPRAPIFVPEDGELFFELLACQPPIKKKFSISGGFPEKPSYEEEIAD